MVGPSIVSADNMLLIINPHLYLHFPELIFPSVVAQGPPVWSKD